jgi:hypothetical protein
MSGTLAPGLELFMCLSFKYMMLRTCDLLLSSELIRYSEDCAERPVSGNVQMCGAEVS